MIFTFILTFSGLIFASERVRPREEMLREGLRPVSSPMILRGGFPKMPFAPHRLAWPVSFQDKNHTLGNSMVEFQPFGTPYFHGGCDLRVASHAEVRTPIAGRVDAGNYDYATNSDGSLQKFWTPWSKSQDSVYFEVAVVTDDQFRFEFHHMDRQSLPPAIVDLLNQGGGRVEAGTLLGNAVEFGQDYNHIHYNIITPEGVRINPEFISPLIADSLPPQVQTVLAVDRNGKTYEFGSGRFDSSIKEFIVAVTDAKDENTYVQPPVLAALTFAQGPQQIWDFHEFLLDSVGSFPNLWSFFAASVQRPNGETLQTDGGYGTGLSLIRLPVPVGAAGKFEITLGDSADNRTTLNGEIL